MYSHISLPLDPLFALPVPLSLSILNVNDRIPLIIKETTEKTNQEAHECLQTRVEVFARVIMAIIYHVCWGPLEYRIEIRDHRDT